MLIQKLDTIINTDREVKADGWSSRRLMLKDDSMGYSLHGTIIQSGYESTILYKIISNQRTV